MATSTVRLALIGDTVVHSAAPNSNYVSHANLNIDGNGSSYRETYFSIAFPAGARGATIQSAKVVFFQKGAASNVSRTLFVYRALKAWSSSAITWNNRPGPTNPPVSRTLTGAGSTGRVVEVDIASLMQVTANGSPFYGLRLSTATSGILNFHSTQDPTVKFRPYVEITYSTEPKAPTTLNPGAGRAVAVAKPVLDFDFTDTSGNVQMVALQVQINSGNAWTSPSFDSGEVASTASQYDLAGSAYGGIPSGGSMWWRVRVKDGAGLWSGWSVGTQVYRYSKGSITINNPAASPSNFVEEATPPIDWSFTGETQTAWQVLILDADVPSRVVADSGKRSNSDTAWTVGTTAAGVPLIQPGRNYVLEVRVWDSKNRASIAGDPAYTSAQRPFTFKTTTSVTPTASLSVEAIDRSPRVRLTWTRATAPDSFTVVRDGRLIKPGLIAADLLVSGTTYSWVDHTADPRVPHTWSVQAVVNGKASASNSQASLTTRPRGIWLMDPARDIAIEIDGDDEGDFEMPDQGETHEVLGSPYPVRLTQALGAYRGAIAGVLVTSSDGGPTASQKKAAMWRVKEEPSRVYYLALADLCLPVNVFNVMVSPSPIDELMFGVALEYFQVAGLPFEAL